MRRLLRGGTRGSLPARRAARRAVRKDPRQDLLERRDGLDAGRRPPVPVDEQRGEPRRTGAVVVVVHRVADVEHGAGTARPPAGRPRRRSRARACSSPKTRRHEDAVEEGRQAEAPKGAAAGTSPSCSRRRASAPRPGAPRGRRGPRGRPSSFPAPGSAGRGPAEAPAGGRRCRRAAPRPRRRRHARRRALRPRWTSAPPRGRAGRRRRPTS